MIDITYKTQVPDGELCCEVINKISNNSGARQWSVCKHLLDNKRCILHGVQLEETKLLQRFKCRACLALVEASK